MHCIVVDTYDVIKTVRLLVRDIHKLKMEREGFCLPHKTLKNLDDNIKTNQIQL